MKTTNMETLDQVNTEAMNLLYEELGVSKTIRFVRQFRRGEGEYTKKKREVFGDESVEDIVKDMRGE